MYRLYKNGKDGGRNILLLLSGLLMVAGVAGYILFIRREAAAWSYLAGAVAFTIAQTLQAENSENMVLRRLQQLQRLSGLMLVLSGLLMVDDIYLWLLPLFNNYITFVTYVYNKWVLLMLIGALMQLYTTLRIASLKKNEKMK